MPPNYTIKHSSEECKSGSEICAICCWVSGGVYYTRGPTSFLVSQSDFHNPHCLYHDLKLSYIFKMMVKYHIWIIDDVWL